VEAPRKGIKKGCAACRVSLLAPSNREWVSVNVTDESASLTERVGFIVEGVSRDHQLANTWSVNGDSPPNVGKAWVGGKEEGRGVEFGKCRKALIKAVRFMRELTFFLSFFFPSHATSQIPSQSVKRAYVSSTEPDN